MASLPPDFAGNSALFRGSWEKTGKKHFSIKPLGVIMVLYYSFTYLRRLLCIR